MNSQVVKLIADLAWAILEADPEFKNSVDEMNKIGDKLKGNLTDEECEAIRDAAFAGGRHMIRILLPLALELGLRPATIFNLPEINGHIDLLQ